MGGSESAPSKDDTWDWRKGAGLAFILAAIFASGALLAPYLSALVMLGAGMSPQEAGGLGKAMAPVLKALGAVGLLIFGILMLAIGKRVHIGGNSSITPFFGFTALVIAANLGVLILRGIVGW